MTKKRNKIISIARDFSCFPAGRYHEDSKASGQAFRDNILVSALKDKHYSKVRVVFDGVASFGSSFLEEAFGGLVQECNFPKDFLDEHLELYTSEEGLEDFVRLARRYIERASVASQCQN